MTAASSFHDEPQPTEPAREIAAPPKRRATRLSVDQLRAVDHFANALAVTFPRMLGVTIVGSSLTRDDWRDVDVRVIVEDRQITALTSVIDLDDLHMLLSRWGQQMTSLPIDCQLQRLSEHDRLGWGPNGAPLHHWRGYGRLGANALRLRMEAQ